MKKSNYSNKSDRKIISPEEVISSTKLADSEIATNENNIFSHLSERNLIANISNKDLITNPKLAKEFFKNNPKMYIGFDPTAEALHLGNLVGIITALRFASFGINPVFLIGGATGQIGDPSGKNKERPLLDTEKVQNNLNFINSNIQKILQSICTFKDFTEFHKSKSNGIFTSDSSDGEVLNVQKILRRKRNEAIPKGSNIDDILLEDSISKTQNELLLDNFASKMHLKKSHNSIDNLSADLVEEQISQMEVIQKILFEEERKSDNLSNSKINLLNKKISIKCDIIDNNEFYKDLNIIDFLRSVGTSLRMGPMLSRETIKNRVNSADGMSLTEFMYQTFQGFDYLKLFELFNVRIQIGGSDQWGNMLAGYELIKKLKNIDVVNLTFPLLTTANGQKFGKSEGNAFFLNEHMTPINNIYQYFYNIQDADLEKLFYAFTFIEKEEINDILSFHSTRPEGRTGHKILAEKIVSMLYSEDEALKCKKRCETHYLANKLKAEKDRLENIDELFKGMEVIKLPHNFLESKTKISQLCLDFKLLDTKAACKRLLESGSLLINDNKINKDVVLTKDLLIGGKYFVIKTGKKHTHVFSVKNFINDDIIEKISIEASQEITITNNLNINLVNDENEKLNKGVYNVGKEEVENKISNFI
jgi:tyrosyl-tRNA synthetase